MFQGLAAREREREERSNLLLFGFYVVKREKKRLAKVSSQVTKRGRFGCEQRKQGVCFILLSLLVKGTESKHKKGECWVVVSLQERGRKSRSFCGCNP